MKTLRIFISSPGDVLEERDRARQVVEGLRRRYARRFYLKHVLWEELPLQADLSFQHGIDLVLSQQQGIDIAVFILWSRLGSPLGALIRKKDGGTYRSGTEREFDLMLAARRQSREATGVARPDLLVYTRQDEASFEERLRGKSTDDKTHDLAQKKLVETFIQEEFTDTTTGTNVGAYHRFDRPSTFSQRLRAHLTELLDELAGGDLAEAVWDTDKQGPPFLGLEAFQPRHADVFFGREDEVLEIRHALREQARNGCAFVLLSGASGSGKSSLARAGVLPAIVENELDEQVAEWRTAIVTPSELAPNPTGAMVRILAGDGILPELKAGHADLGDLADVLSRNPADAFALCIKPALGLASQGAHAGVRLLLVLDQLEELFASAAISSEARGQFLAMIEAFARSGSVWIIATARSDFNPQLQSEPALVRLKTGLGTVDVLPPKPDALRRLIEEPARLAKLSFERRDDVALSDRILSDAAAHPELLPLVEYVLRELFEERTDEGGLTFACYERLGGVEGALAKRAEAVFTALSGEAQECLGAVLKSLVTMGQDNQTASPSAANEEHLVRQWAGLSKFPKDGAARLFIDAFVKERLFATAEDPQTKEASFTLAHESLLRVWPRAVAWANYNRDFLLTRARIATRILQGSPLLAGDPLLDAAKAHLATDGSGFSEAQRAFIEESLERAEAAKLRSERNRRKVLAGLSALTVLSLIGCLVALREWSNAKAAATLAVSNEHKAIAAIGLANERETEVKRRIRQAARSDCVIGKLLAVLEGHKDVIKYAHFNDAGDRVVTASNDKTAGVWDAGTGRLLLTLTGSETLVNSAEFSQDGKRIVTASSSDDSRNGAARIWNASTGDLLAILKGHQKSVAMAAFSLDGKFVATASIDDTARIWESATGKLTATLEGHSDKVWSARFSHDGRRVVTASNDKTCRMWETETGALLATVHGPTGWVGDACFSSDDKRLILSCGDKTARILELGEPHASTPGWWPDFLRALADREFDQKTGGISVISRERREELLAAVQTALRGDHTRISDIARWFLTEPSERPLRPGSPLSAAAVADSLITNDAPRSDLLRAYELDPLHPLIHIAFAREAEVEGRGKFLLNYGISRIPAGAPADLQARAAALQEAPHTATALRARAKLLTQLKRFADALVVRRQLITLPEATAQDFADAAYCAARLGDEVLTRAILTEGAGHYPKDESIPFWAGWCFIDLNDPAEALAAFGKFQSLLSSEETVTPAFLRGQAVAQWLTNDKAAAMDTCKRLIDAEPKWADKKTFPSLSWPTWPDAEKIPLEAACIATLEKHPELAPKPESPKDEE